MSNLNKFIPWVLVVVVSVGLSVLFGGETITKETILKDKPVGALTGPILPYNDFGFGGVRFWGSGRSSDVGLQQGTSTICSLQAPTATSTLLNFTTHVHNATGTATLVLEVARATTAFATTTSLTFGTRALAAQSHQTFSFVASTTGSTNSLIQTDPRWEFGPNEFLNVKVGGATGDVNSANSAITYANYAPVGSCGAIWQVL